jgi:hypothetical protein
MSFTGSEEIRASGERRPAGAGRAEEINDYVLESILVTLFCCQPFGIIALVYATQVKSYLIGGFIKEAREASEKAKNWSSAGFWSALVLIAVSLFFLLLVKLADID